MYVKVSSHFAGRGAVVTASVYLCLELGVLGFGLPIDGKIGTGVLPNVKEFFLRFAGGCVVAH
jgi:hypothetical protein